MTITEIRPAARRPAQPGLGAPDLGDDRWDEQALWDCSDLAADEMANGFARIHPDLAARAGFRRWQVAAGVALTLAVLAALVLAPTVLALLFTALTTFVSVVLLWVAGHGRRLSRGRITDPVAPAVPDAELPFYTVLVPAYHEEAVIGDAVRCLSQLDYPADRIEVLILVERRDFATQQAIAAADPAPFIRTVQIPPGGPQTKPRSCNAGLMIARGELIVIFDAEDRPDADQLRIAAAAFAAGEDTLACVQAQLEISNPAKSVITRQFWLEYQMRYRLMLPGLSRLRMPIPLGGTSNHFRTRVLRSMGGWDAWNVTEDADLGMRCRSLGFEVRTIDSVTRGEAPAELRPWVKQRTRWLKGFLLTTLVHTRHPWRFWRSFGGTGLLAMFAFVVGAPLMFLTQPIVTAIAATGYTGTWEPIAHSHLIMTAASGVTLVAWFGLMWSLGSDGRGRRMVCGLLLPMYWAMPLDRGVARPASTHPLAVHLGEDTARCCGRADRNRGGGPGSRLRPDPLRIQHSRCGFPSAWKYAHPH